MPSLGFLGAIGGAAEGFNKGIQQQIEEARATRIEQLRAQNQQELFRQNNEQRHGFSLTEIQKQDELQMGRLQEQDRLNRNRAEWERSLPPTETYRHEKLDDGTPIDVNEATNQRKTIGSSAAAAAKVYKHDIRDFEELDEFGNARRVPRQIVTDPRDGRARYMDIEEFNMYLPAPQDPSQRIKGETYTAPSGFRVIWDGQGWLKAD